MVSKICDAMTQRHHRTGLGVAHSSMENGLSSGAIFCMVNRRLAKSPRAHVAGPEVATLKGCCPMKNWMSHRRIGWWAVSAPPWQYSPGWRRKNKSIQVRSIMACWRFVPPWQAESRDWRTDTGTGWTMVGGGYLFVYIMSCRPRRKSSFLNLLWQGSMDPTAENVFLMKQRYCLTECFLMGYPPASRSPACTRSANIWRKWTGSLTFWSSDGIRSQTQNLRHWCRAVVSFWYSNCLRDSAGILYWSRLLGTY